MCFNFLKNAFKSIFLVYVIIVINYKEKFIWTIQTQINQL